MFRTTRLSQACLPRLWAPPTRRPSNARKQTSPQRAGDMRTRPGQCGSEEAGMIGVAVVGYGYWGPNLVRNFWEVPGVKLVSVCDLRTDRLGGVQARYPAVEITGDLNDVLKDTRVDAIAIATPVSSHFDLALRALQAGKHVFV